MKIGTVKGAVWATRKAQCLQGRPFLWWTAAARKLWRQTRWVAARFCMDAPVDAAVVAIVDMSK